jgi:FkbM family methyltransferase
MNDPISIFLKTNLPAKWVEFIQGCLYRGFFVYSRFFFQQARLERNFRRKNAGESPNSFVLKKEIRFKIQPKAREAFQFFAFTDPVMVEEMNNFICLSKKCRCLLDIGALYGIFSLVFSSRRDAVSYAFEPFQESYEILSQHAKENPEMNIFPIFSAVGEKKGTVEMFQNGFHLICRGEKDQMEPLQRCPLTSIDEFVKEQGIIPDILKIDVEGFEEKVLLGGKEFLKKHTPLIFLELHPHLLKNQRSSHEAIIAFLKNLGFNLFSLSQKPLEEKELYEIGKEASYRIICSKSATF